MPAVAVLLTACSGEQPAASVTCPPDGWDLARLGGLKAAEFEIADPLERRTFALGVAACLASPDPLLRDGVAYEGLSRLLRAGQLDAATQAALVDDLLPRLEVVDPLGFERPFAALVLSELARAERLSSCLEDTTRAQPLERSIEYFVTIRDYRGFGARDGWRHGVAHGADLLMQLVLDQRHGRVELTRIRDAVATQVAPTGHFYTYGEPERLARPILVIAEREMFTAEEWSAWFEQIASPAPLASWSEAFSSQEGLAKRHDTLAFVQTLWIQARSSESAGAQALLGGAEAALRTLP